MSTDFSRTLSLLRREKGVSQRTAAETLGISQALLSHYENGIREPGLSFVVKACDYYQVSADYLLGRTLSKDGAMIDAQELYDVSEHKDNALRGSIMAQLNKKLLVNALTVIYGMLGKLGDRPLIMAVSEYFSCAVYLVFRQIYNCNDQNPAGFFGVEESAFWGGLVNADMQRTACEISMEVERLREDKTLQEKMRIQPKLDEAFLQREFPALYQSLLQLLHNTGNQLNALLSWSDQQRQKAQRPQKPATKKK